MAPPSGGVAGSTIDLGDPFSFTPMMLEGHGVGVVSSNFDKKEVLEKFHSLPGGSSVNPNLI